MQNSNETMELETSSSLDLKITKEDLIDMIIDKKMTELESLLEPLKAEKAKLIEAINQIEKDSCDRLEADLIKRLPKILQKLKFSEISYYKGSKSTNVCFYFEADGIKADIDLNNQNTVTELTKQESKDKKSFEDKKDKLNQEIQILEKELYDIEHSNKRTKAKMITAFLGRSSSGNQILNLLDQTNNKLLAAPAKKK